MERHQSGDEGDGEIAIETSAGSFARRAGVESPRTSDRGSESEGSPPQAGESTFAEEHTPRLRGTNASEQEGEDDRQMEEEMAEEENQLRTEPKGPLVRRNRRLRTEVISSIGRDTSARLKLVIENLHRISDVYTIDSAILGKGGFGCVRRCAVKCTGSLRAVKSIGKEQAKHKQERLKREIKVTKMLDHPGVIKLYEVFEDEKSIFLVMELCTGGTLHARAQAEGRLYEATAGACMLQILQAMHYLHTSHICHRDMKPQNVLCASYIDLDDVSLKITDFGLSCCMDPHDKQKLKARVGTAAYMSPQVYKRCYDTLCDCWSCGVMMYYLLVGYLPFSGRDREEMKRRILSCSYSFADMAWANISEDAVELVRGLLQRKASDRLTAECALRLAWFKKPTEEQLEKCRSVDLPEDLADRLLRFRALNKFKQAALHLVVSSLSEEQVDDSCKMFMWLDADGDGHLSIEDLRQRLSDSCIALIEDYCYTEFLAATFDPSSVKKDVFEYAFGFFDKDNNGKISVDELTNNRSLLGELSPQDCQDLVDAIDLNGDGVIDVNEFREMLLREDSRNLPRTLTQKHPLEKEPTSPKSNSDGGPPQISPTSKAQKTAPQTAPESTSEPPPSAAAPPVQARPKSRMRKLVQKDASPSPTAPTGPRRTHNDGLAEGGGAGESRPRLLRGSSTGTTGTNPSTASTASPKRQNSSDAVSQKSKQASTQKSSRSAGNKVLSARGGRGGKVEGDTKDGRRNRQRLLGGRSESNHSGRSTSAERISRGR